MSGVAYWPDPNFIFFVRAGTPDHSRQPGFHHVVAVSCWSETILGLGCAWIEKDHHRRRSLLCLCIYGDWSSAKKRLRQAMFLVNHTRYQSPGDAIISVIHVLAERRRHRPISVSRAWRSWTAPMCTRIYSRKVDKFKSCLCIWSISWKNAVSWYMGSKKLRSVRRWFFCNTSFLRPAVRDPRSPVCRILKSRCVAPPAKAHLEWKF